MHALGTLASMPGVVESVACSNREIYHLFLPDSEAVVGGNCGRGGLKKLHHFPLNPHFCILILCDEGFTKLVLSYLLPIQNPCLTCRSGFLVAYSKLEFAWPQFSSNSSYYASSHPSTMIIAALWRVVNAAFSPPKWLLWLDGTFWAGIRTWATTQHDAFQSHKFPYTAISSILTNLSEDDGKCE